MTDAVEGIGADEFVFRRIHKNQVQAGKPPLLSYVGFRPTPDDTAGLSLYREKHISADQVAAGGRRPGEYYVVRLAVQSIRTLGLTVIADEQPEGLAGHASIPELSIESCKLEKSRTREIQVRLAELAARDIVVVPIA